MSKVKKLLGIFLSVCMISSYGFSVTAEEEETVIVMSDIGITVDGSDISQNADENVYLSEVTETHADVAQELKDVKNKVVTITKPGTYRFSGKISDAQIAVAAGEDGVAHITINGGYVFCNAVGTEGDGIDSNGYITINGGTVIALASPNSMDSGIDSDRGSVINGGTVVGAGNMFDELDENSGQLYMFLQFSEATDDLICITDSSDNPVFAYDFPFSYSYISLSCPQLEEGTYHVYKGGEASGTQSDGLYTDISSYTKGTQMHHGGISYSTGRPGGMTPPDGMTPPEGMDVPCRNRRRGTFQS